MESMTRNQIANELDMLYAIKADQYNRISMLVEELRHDGYKASVKAGKNLRRVLIGKAGELDGIAASATVLLGISHEEFMAIVLRTSDNDDVWHSDENRLTKQQILDALAALYRERCERYSHTAAQVTTERFHRGHKGSPKALRQPTAPQSHKMDGIKASAIALGIHAEEFKAAVLTG